MTNTEMPKMGRWSDAKLDKELSFALASFDGNHKENVEWLSAILLELLRRTPWAEKEEAA